jgi:hypothetical protein
MPATGRPRGTGYDDLLKIVRIRAHMKATGCSRRASIIELYGLDQLRRLEKKMAALDPAQIPEMLNSRLRSAQALAEQDETISALMDEGFLVLRGCWHNATGQHLASNTLNPFAPC